MGRESSTAFSTGTNDFGMARLRGGAVRAARNGFKPQNQWHGRARGKRGYWRSAMALTGLTAASDDEPDEDSKVSALVDGRPECV